MVDVSPEQVKVQGVADPTIYEDYAERELRRWLEGIADQDDPTSKQAVIQLVADGSLSGEEFSIIPAEYGIRISGGRPRGVLYGVYEFLDRYGGVRWLSHDCTHTPDKGILSIPEPGICFEPLLSYREPYITEAFDGDWSARNRMNSNRADLQDYHGGKITYAGFVHTFNKLVPPEEYFSSHPEYFSELDGERISEKTQLCLTNPDVVRIAAQRAISWLRENPQADIVSVSQNDWRNPCQCRECSRIDEEEGTHAGSLLHFVNRVAERIEEEFPDKLVDTLAYQYTRKPPRNIRPRKNVVVRLCSIECCFSHPLAECPENREFRTDTQGWSRVAHTLHVWDYVTNFRHYLMPFPNLRVLQPNVRFFAYNSVKGIFEEGNYSDGGGGAFAALKSYLLSRILWKPYCDLESAMEEFTEGYYGEAGKGVREYIDLLHDDVESKGVHVRIYDDPDHFLDMDMIDNYESIIQDAEKKCRNPDEKARVRKVRLPLAYSRMFLMEEGDQKRRLMREFVEECRALGITEVSERKSVGEFDKRVENQ